VLACDGLWDVCTSEEAIEAIHTNIYKDKFRTEKISDLEFNQGVEELVDDCCT